MASTNYSQDEENSERTHGHCETQSEHVKQTSFWFCINLLFAFLSIALFFVDVVSDILLAREYYNEGMMWQFGLTAFFVIVPSIIICAWTLNYHSFFKLYRPVMRVTYIIMTFLIMSPVISQLEYIYHTIKHRRKSSSKELTNEERVKLIQYAYYFARGLCMVECFLEAAPQLTLQVYNLLQHRDDETLLTEVIRAVAIFSSWISMTWSIVAFAKILFLNAETNMTITGMTFYILWRATEIGTRIIAICLFATQFSYYVSIVVGVHWLLMCILLSYEQYKEFHEGICGGLLIILITSCEMVFCFITGPTEGREICRRLFYYTVVYIENCLMIGLWFHFTDDKGVWFHIPTLLIVVCGFFVQLIFQLTYYRWFHPKRPMDKSCCPPCRVCISFWCPCRG